jgi:lipopolysaccharide transport system permease protein
MNVRPVKIIEPKRGLRSLGLHELAGYHDLFYFLVWRDVKVLYKQTVLGFGWAILRPVFTMIIFSIIFGRLAKIPSDGVPYPLFSYVALVPWTYFQTAMVSSSTSLITGSRLISRIYFPRVILPLSPVFSGLVDFVIAFSIVGLLMAFYGVAPSWNIVVVPLLVVMMGVAAAGIGLWSAALAVQYRDFRFGMPFLGQILMYAAPVVWPASLIPDKYRLFYGLYPMAGVIEGFRSALLNTNPMPWDIISVGAVSATVLFVTGFIFFRRTERFVADVA